MGTDGDDAITATNRNDLIDGGLGNDVLSGGTGSDTYQFNQTNNNLEITLLGSSDSIAVNNWFTFDNYAVENIQLSSGKYLGAQDVNNMVAAMAAFNLPVNGEITLTAEEQIQVFQIIISNWNVA